MLDASVAFGFKEKFICGQTLKVTSNAKAFT